MKTALIRSFNIWTRELFFPFFAISKKWREKWFPILSESKASVIRSILTWIWLLWIFLHDPVGETHSLGSHLLLLGFFTIINYFEIWKQQEAIDRYNKNWGRLGEERQRALGYLLLVENNLFKLQKTYDALLKEEAEIEKAWEEQEEARRLRLKNFTVQAVNKVLSADSSLEDKQSALYALLSGLRVDEDIAFFAATGEEKNAWLETHPVNTL